MRPAIYYRLDGHTPVPVRDALTWAAWYECADRAVTTTRTEEAMVSTVFLGLDHALGAGPPVLFETMVFGGPMNDYTDRYHTWEEALRGHAAIVAQVRARERTLTTTIRSFLRKAGWRNR